MLSAISVCYWRKLGLRFSLKEFFDKQYDILAQQLIGHSTDTVTVSAQDVLKMKHAYSDEVGSELMSFLIS